MQRPLYGLGRENLVLQSLVQNCSAREIPRQRGGSEQMIDKLGPTCMYHAEAPPRGNPLS